MPRTVTIVTPENIAVTYQVAGFASRFLAFMIDLLIQILLWLATSWLFRMAATGFQLVGLNLGDFISGAGIVVGFLIMFAYASIFEMLWGGRTPGKRLLGLRVIRDGGYPINLTSSAIRNILRFLDFGILPLGLPLILFGLPGLICIFLSPQYKRLGDWAAGTLVIVEAGVSPFAASRPARDIAPLAQEFIGQIRNLERITPAEYRAVRRYTERRATWEYRVQASLAERLARPLLAKLDLNPEVAYQLQYAAWLEAIESRYSEENNLL
jgi:uncharacterized RDD family membrane protein YckC